MSNVHAVIIAGGSGTRFWPASRKRKPKQLLPLVDGKSLLELTIERLGGVVERNRIWIVTNADQAEGIQELLPDFPGDQIIVEPEARDTAPCVALAYAKIAGVDAAATLAIMPADHLIEPVTSFRALLRRGCAVASQSDRLVTFGIEPDRPATGFGYIERGERIDADSPQAFKVERFREKPDRKTAEEYLSTGRFYWNSGIFLWTCESFRRAIERSAPELGEATEAMLSAVQNDDQAKLEAAFLRTPKISIDYALLEKAPEVAVIEAQLDWTDLGSFAALDRIAAGDAEGNIELRGQRSSVTTMGSKNCTSYVQGDRTLALLGVQDLLVVAVDDAILVCPKSEAENLKQLVDKLREEGRSDLL
ncbi:MAG: mannose-1-phosphate guanylyltransferase [Planctomycetota bacterium]|jgi:mannose-1-phosphate guanylyltransferase